MLSKLKEIDFHSDFERWELLKNQLIELFRSKNGTRSEMMSNGIRLFEDILVKVEHRAFNIEDISMYKIAPLNATERYEFVLHNRNNFAAFRQLDELFKETKKKIAKMRILEGKG